MTDSTNNQLPIYPTQKRTIERFNEILDVVENVFSNGVDYELSIYDVAKLTELPAQSIYRIFPSMNAVYFALVERYLEIESESYKTFDLTQYETWQQGVEAGMLMAKKRYEAHPHIMELLLGRCITGEIRNQEVRNSNKLAVVLSEKTKAYRKSDGDMINQFQILIAMVDSIWALSYNNTKSISEYHFNESVKAALTYLEIYLMRFPR